MDSSIFRTRFKELYKSKGLTQEKLAHELGYGVERIKKYLKNGSEMPPIGALDIIAKFFDVDIAYLLGEQDCKHHADQSICDVTHLSEDAAAVLRGLNGLQSKNLSKFLTHKDFKNLLDNFSKYMLYNLIADSEMYASITDAMERDLNEPLYTSNNEKLLIKSVIKTEFDEMLSTLYDSRNEKEKNMFMIDSVNFYSALIKDYLEKCKDSKLPDPLSLGVINLLIAELSKSCKLLEYPYPDWTTETIWENPTLLDSFIEDFENCFKDYIRLMNYAKSKSSEPIIRPYKNYQPDSE